MITPKTFTTLTGIQDDHQIRALLLHHNPVPTSIPTLRSLTTRVALLLDITVPTAAALLGVSWHRLTPDARPSVDALDRLYALCRTYDLAHNVFGDGTAVWLRTAHPALAGLSPLDLQVTRFGEHGLEAFMQGMLDGAFI